MIYNFFICMHDPDPIYQGEIYDQIENETWYYTRDDYTELCNIHEQSKYLR